MLTIVSPLGYKVNIVQEPRELPSWQGVETAFLDAETNGLHWFHGRRAIGWALIRDNEKEAWYVPYRHSSGRNLPIPVVQQWLRNGLNTVKKWVNHNIKFDAHMADVDGATFSCELHDTLVLAKLIDSERMTYGLKPLCRDWLGQTMSQVNRVEQYLRSLYGHKYKSGVEAHGYEEVPIDICGEYACEDVWSNRLLYAHIMEQIPAEVCGVRDTEIKLTPVLFDMEKLGLRTNPLELRKEELVYTVKTIHLVNEIQRITGREFTDSPAHLQDLFLNHYGLPILAWNEEKDDDTGEYVQKGPCFDKDALKLYTIHPTVLADPELMEFIRTLLQYRADSHYLSTYVQAFQKWAGPDGYIHPDYKQVIRTGRMSAKDPNIMGQTKASKRLLLPDSDEWEFISSDASQIEFRFIVHYIKDESAIKAYCENPRTDFHTWVAQVCGIKRHPAKTMNFLMGFGGGKKKATSELSGNPDVMAEIGAVINALVEHGKVKPEQRNVVYKRLCYEKASQIYHDYHARLPGIKAMSQLAKDNCSKRGYVFNAFGRRRHLSPKFARKAFNAAVQGGAMDYIKTRIVALSPRYNSDMRNWQISIRANVHDEVLQHGPKGIYQEPQVQKAIEETLEYQPVKFRVPFKWDTGASAENWAEAAK